MKATFIWHLSIVENWLRWKSTYK